MWPTFGTVFQPKTHLALFGVRPSFSVTFRKFLRLSWWSSSDLLPMITSSRYAGVRFKFCWLTKAVISRWNVATAFMSPKRSLVNSKICLFNSNGVNGMSLRWSAIWWHADFKLTFENLVFPAAWSSGSCIFGHIWEEKHFGRVTIFCLRVLDHHPWLGTVPNDKSLCRPGRCENLYYARSEHAGNLGLRASDVLRFVTAQLCNDRICTEDCTGECGRRGNFHFWEHQFIQPGTYSSVWPIAT